jgi:hypothetical protein
MLQHPESAGNGEHGNHEAQQGVPAPHREIGLGQRAWRIRSASAQGHVGQEHLDLRQAAWSRLQERRWSDRATDKIVGVRSIVFVQGRVRRRRW